MILPFLHATDVIISTRRDKVYFIKSIKTALLNACKLTRPISCIDYHAFAINALLWIKEMKYGRLNNTENNLVLKKIKQICKSYLVDIQCKILSWFQCQFVYSLHWSTLLIKILLIMYLHNFYRFFIYCKTN
jgi:hypothetical protein